jgi:large subunit ribosomal protein L17
MRHAKNSQRLSRPSEHREAMLGSLVKGLVIHGQVTTTHARAKVAQRLADRLVTLGKEGSIHARRRAFRILQNRTLVNRLFSDVAPRFLDVRGGYTRVVRLSPRLGDGAQKAVLAFSLLPAVEPPTPARVKTPQKPKAPTPAPSPDQPEKAEEAAKPKGLFEGLRKLWTKKKKGSAAS